jgi:hypothetical protein
LQLEFNIGKKCLVQGCRTGVSTQDFELAN